MAHQIDNMAYAGETPWHGLGNQLEEHQPIEVWAKEAGLDWTIQHSPAHFIISEGDNPIGKLEAVADKQVLYRSDTHAPLSVVGARYKIVQPHQILEFYRDLTERSGFQLETAGSLKGGKKIWALARTGQSGELKGGDITNGYVLLATACDGSMATTAQLTSVRVVCNNTLALALRGASSGAVKVPHNTHFDAQLVKQQLGITISAWSDFMYELKTLSNRKIKNKEAMRFLSHVFTPQSTTPGTQPNQKAIAQTFELFEGKGRGSTLESSQGTAFGLLNAVTEFVDHKRRSRNSDYRLDSAWFGQGAQLKQRALTEALELAA